LDTPPPSPPARRLRPPTWINARVIVGVLLVAGSVVAGSATVTAADRSVRVWALTRDVAASTVLSAQDVRPARVRLFDTAPRYLSTTRSPAGRTVTRALSAGELLPVTAVRTGDPALVVNLPVRPENAPSLQRGQAVEVWAGTKDCGPRRVLASAAVQDVRTDGSGALATGTGLLQVVLRVGRADADRLLAVLGVDSTIRLVVVDGAPAGASVTPCDRDGGTQP
jgi:hypothetical protein